MLKFAFKHMAVRRAKLVLIALSILITACVALLSYNISTQVSEGIIRSASNFDLIIGPSGSSTQLAMNTLFFTDKPLGTIPYSIVEELQSSGLVNAAVPFSMGDSYNDAPIVGTEPALLDGRALKEGEMFDAAREAVVGSDVAAKYGLNVGDSIVTSHGLGGSGHDHAEAPLTIVGILKRSNTSFDSAVFTPVETIWALHDHTHEEETAAEAPTEGAVAADAAVSESAPAAGLPSHISEAHDEDHSHDEEAYAHDEESHDHDHDSDKTICAVLVRSKDFAAVNALMIAYGDDAGYLAINPNTVLREVLENVDMTRNIVYILCAVILVMNIFVISMIALLNAYDARKEIMLMRLIGVSMGRINLLYLIQNAMVNAAALLLSLLAAHAGLAGIRSFVAGMGIALDAAKIYPLEWGILALVFIVSILPTSILTARMSRQDGIDR